jgi:hypothetical protein
MPLIRLRSVRVLQTNIHIIQMGTYAGIFEVTRTGAFFPLVYGVTLINVYI